MKNKHLLKELAKFGAGLTTAGALFVLWLYFMGMFPITIMGMTFTEAIVLPKFVFNVALAFIFAHYGWHIGKLPKVREQQYLLIVGTLLTLVAIVHILRLFFAFEVVIGTWVVPLWLSWFGVIITSYLAYASFHFALVPKNKK